MYVSVFLGSVDAEKHLVKIFHDESIFQSHEDQSTMWAMSDQTSIKPKGKGAGIMVSDFIEEFGGFLSLTDDDVQSLGNPTDLPNSPCAARVLLEYGQNREGYWKSEKFMEQVKKAVSIAEAKYPQDRFTLLFIFDQSCNHTAKAPDALVANKMNVKPGGGQPQLRDTIFRDAVQSFNDENGGPHALFEEWSIVI